MGAVHVLGWRLQQLGAVLWKFRRVLRRLRGISQQHGKVILAKQLQWIFRLYAEFHYSGLRGTHELLQQFFLPEQWNVLLAFEFPQALDATHLLVKSHQWKSGE
jgi:hypothetical protein